MAKLECPRCQGLVQMAKYPDGRKSILCIECDYESTNTEALEQSLLEFLE